MMELAKESANKCKRDRFEDFPRPFTTDSLVTEKFGHVDVTCLSRRRPPPVFHADDEMQLDCCVIVTVTEVIDPGRFYVKYFTGHKLDEGNLLQEFYNNPRNIEHYKLRGGRPLYDRYYVFRLTASNLWEVGRCTQINLSIRTSTVYALNTEIMINHVDFDNLYELCPDHFAHPERSFECALSDVVPPNKLKDWEENSTEAFKKLALGQELHCLISKKTTEYLPCGHPNMRLKLKVVLLENQSARTINAKLCADGLAASVGRSACIVDPSTAFESLVKFQFPEKYRNRLESKPNPVASTSEAVPGVDAETKKLTNVRPAPAFYQYSEKNMSLIQGFKSKVPQHVQDYCKLVRILYCKSPSSIYVQEVDKLQELYEMTMKLSVQASNSDRFLVKLLKVGEFVAVRTPDDPLYYRAIVLELTSIEQVVVFLIDFGSIMEAYSGSTKLLPPEYLRIPGFASRVYLDVHLKPGRYSWPQMTNSTPGKFANEYGRDRHLCYLYITNPEPVILEEFDQPVAYDHGTQCWEAGSPRCQEYQKALDLRKGHQVLRKLYEAVGGDIIFQHGKCKPYATHKLSAEPRLSRLIQAPPPAEEQENS